MNKRVILTILTSVIVITLLMGFVLYFTTKSNWNGEITKFSWYREWDVERYQFVSGNCWFRGCQPDRAYNIQENLETHHYKSVYRGQTCSGYGEDRKCKDDYDSVPVKEIKIYYTINDWRLGRIAKSSGDNNNLDNLYWPDLNLNVCDNSLTPGVGINDTLLNCERESAQREWFYITIDSKMVDNNHVQLLTAKCAIDYPRWTDMNIGFKVSGSYWTYQKLIDCNELKFN